MPSPAALGPAIILVRPQLGVNIGTAARAMLNSGLTDLRLVAPREGWPNEHATPAAAGAVALLEQARVFPDVASATADLQRVYATTWRGRELVKWIVTPRQAAQELRQHAAEGTRCGVLFGPERTGLVNDDLSLADTILTVPLNPGFSSLNLAQAVLLVSWEWRMAGDATPVETFDPGDHGMASRQDMLGLFDHLEAELEAANYFANIAHKRESMVRNIRNSLQRGAMTNQDVRTLRGIVKALANGRPGTKRRPRGWKPPPSDVS